MCEPFSQSGSYLGNGEGVTMTNCPFCFQTACVESEFETCVIEVANDNVNLQFGDIQVPSDDVLNRPHVVRRMAIFYASLGLSRYKIANFVNDQIWDFAGDVFDAGGRYIELLLIDAGDVFRSEADPSDSWLGAFLSNAREVPKQLAQNRVLPRLRLLWLAMTIANRRLGAGVIR
jgi:hypothetical protein